MIIGLIGLTQIFVGTTLEPLAATIEDTNNIDIGASISNGCQPLLEGKSELILFIRVYNNLVALVKNAMSTICNHN